MCLAVNSNSNLFTARLGVCLAVNSNSNSIYSEVGGVFSSKL